MALGSCCHAAPAYVVGYVYADLLDVTGPVQTLLRDWAGLRLGDYYFPAVRSLPGASVVIALVLYPYIYLLAKTSFENQSGALYESARVLGAGRQGLFWRVALPVARPAAVGGLALVLMETIADYGVVEHFGVPTFTTGIFRTWYAMGEHDAALKLAGCLFMLVALLVLLEQCASRQGFNPLSRNVPAQKIQLSGLSGVGASILCFLPVLGGFLVPVGSLLLLALSQGDQLLGVVFILMVSTVSLWGLLLQASAPGGGDLKLCPTIAPRTLAEHRCAFSDLGLCLARYGIGGWGVAAYDSS